MAGKLVRICEGLVNKLEKIKEQERERGISNPSDNHASEVLNKRIDNAGGLR